MSLDPDRAVAAFDSASVLHASVVAALEQRPLRHLGNPPIMGPIVRAASRMPWPLVRELYRRIGGSEGVDPRRLGDVDGEAIAAAFAEAYPDAVHPAVVVGSSNGAIAHLAAAMQVPWLPSTVLVPVRRLGDPERPDVALAFGREAAVPLLDANPSLDLHQMHDPAQDELMTARLAYFRVKWTTLPVAYERLLARRLAPGAPLVVVDDRSQWPVTRVAERHVFQTGGRGGPTPEQHLAHPFAPVADEVAPEAEWGAPTGFVEAAVAWAGRSGHPVVHVRLDGPQSAAGPVADVLRRWTRERGGAGDSLIVPSFVLGDPWQSFRAGLVPFWTFFPVDEALESLDAYLAAAEPFTRVELLVFQHGVDSPGRATPARFEEVVRRHGAEPRLLGLRAASDPHDLGALARYTPALRRLPAGPPWRPLDVATGLRALRESADGERMRVDVR